jgi:hypothetical protein
VHYPAREARSHRPHEGGRPASSLTRVSRGTVGGGVAAHEHQAPNLRPGTYSRASRHSAMINRSHNAMPAPASGRTNCAVRTCGRCVEAQRCTRHRHRITDAEREPELDNLGSVMDQMALPTNDLVSSVRLALITLCYRRAGWTVARIVTRGPEHAVRREHSGARALLSVQVVCLERYAGLLVMRRSGVRFPKAAQLEDRFR